MLIFLLGANRPGAKRLGGRNDQGRNDLGRNAAGAKRLGGELDLGRNDPDSAYTSIVHAFTSTAREVSNHGVLIRRYCGTFLFANLVNTYASSLFSFPDEFLICCGMFDDLG